MIYSDEIMSTSDFDSSFGIEQDGDVFVSSENIERRTLTVANRPADPEDNEIRAWPTGQRKQVYAIKSVPFPNSASGIKRNALGFPTISTAIAFEVNEIVQQTLTSLQRLHMSNSVSEQWGETGRFIASVFNSEETFRLNLDLALRDLNCVKKEAQEEGFVVPNEIAIRNAELILNSLADETHHRIEVYPIPTGEIALDVPNGEGSSVMVLCDLEGGALCSVNMKGEHRRARYSSTVNLPDSFMYEALDELNSMR